MTTGATLRLASADDGAAVAAIYAPYVAGTVISFELDPPSADEMAGRIDATVPRWPWLLAEADAEVVGFAHAGLHRSRPAYRWSVEVSIYLARVVHRRGLGRRLYGALFTLLAEQGYCQAFAGTTLPNDASVALHEAVGFRHLGTYRSVGFKGGAWHDVAWWQRPLRGSGGEPPEILSLDDLPTSVVGAALR